MPKLRNRANEIASVFKKPVRKERDPLARAMAKLSDGRNEPLSWDEMHAVLKAHPWNDHLWWQTHPNLIPF